MKDVKKAIRYSCEDINSGNISGQGICVAVLDTGECVIILQSSPAKRGELYIHKLKPFVCHRRKPTTFRWWEEPCESLAINPDSQYTFV